MNIEKVKYIVPDSATKEAHEIQARHDLTNSVKVTIRNGILKATGRHPYIFAFAFAAPREWERF